MGVTESVRGVRQGPSEGRDGRGSGLPNGLVFDDRCACSNNWVRVWCVYSAHAYHIMRHDVTWTVHAQLFTLIG